MAATPAAAATVQTLALAGLGASALAVGTADPHTLWLLRVGVVLGTAYVVSGGELPAWVGRASRRTERGVNADNNPTTLPPRIHLPILAVVILLAVAAWFVYGPRR